MDAHLWLNRSSESKTQKSVESFGTAIDLGGDCTPDKLLEDVVFALAVAHGMPSEALGNGRAGGNFMPAQMALRSLPVELWSPGWLAKNSSAVRVALVDEHANDLNLVVLADHPTLSEAARAMGFLDRGGDTKRNLTKDIEGDSGKTELSILTTPKTKLGGREVRGGSRVLDLSTITKRDAVQETQKEEHSTSAKSLRDHQELDIAKNKALATITKHLQPYTHFRMEMLRRMWWRRMLPLTLRNSLWRCW